MSASSGSLVGTGEQLGRCDAEPGGDELDLHEVERGVAVEEAPLNPRESRTPLAADAVEPGGDRRLGPTPREVRAAVGPGLAQAVPTVSRSQLYLLMRGQAVIDVAELFAVCEALGLTPLQVIAEAEAAVGDASAIAAYDEAHAIEDEQGAPPRWYSPRPSTPRRRRASVPTRPASPSRSPSRRS